MCGKSSRPLSSQQQRIMRTSLRPAAVIYELIIQKCKAFPLRLFDLLSAQDPQAAAERIQDVSRNHPCLMDSFSRAFVKEFDTVEKLTSTAARLVLASLSLQTFGNTYSTECLHSRHARRVRGRQQTHVHEIASSSSMASWPSPAWLDC